MICGWNAQIQIKVISIQARPDDTVPKTSARPKSSIGKK
jgi:hypothetical protein